MPRTLRFTISNCQKNWKARLAELYCSTSQFALWSNSGLVEVACNSTGRLSALQTSLYRAHAYYLRSAFSVALTHTRRTVADISYYQSDYFTIVTTSYPYFLHPNRNSCWDFYFTHCCWFGDAARPWIGGINILGTILFGQERVVVYYYKYIISIMNNAVSKMKNRK